jgi:hypothetical protein
MEMVDYPQAIAEASKQFLKADQQVRHLEKEVKRLQLEVSKQVTFDPALKNQNQRDCRNAELLNENPQYQALLTQLETARDERSLIGFELRYLKDRFSSLKLALLAKLEFLNRVETPNDIRVHLAGLGLQGLFSAYGGITRTTPSEAANQILTFVEALAAELQVGEPMTDELWLQKMSTPEFHPEEAQGSEFGDETEGTFD